MAFPTRLRRTCVRRCSSLKPIGRDLATSVLKENYTHRKAGVHEIEAIERVGSDKLDVRQSVFRRPLARTSQLERVDVGADDAACITDPFTQKVGNAAGATTKIENPQTRSIANLRPALCGRRCERDQPGSSIVCAEVLMGYLAAAISCIFRLLDGAGAESGPYRVLASHGLGIHHSP
jgi:hypothetical protein